MATGGLLTILLVVLIVWQLDSIKEVFNTAPVKNHRGNAQVDQNRGNNEQIEVGDSEDYPQYQKEPVSNTPDLQYKADRTDVLETVNQAEDSFHSPGPVLRPASERTREISIEIGNLKEISTQTNLRRIFSLKTAIFESPGINPELVFSVNNLLEKMELVRNTDQGACDLLVAMKDNSKGISLTIHSNLFGDEGKYVNQENYHFINVEQLLTSLETIFLKYYCFNIIRSLDLLKPIDHGYDIEVTLNGGSSGMFQVGNSIEICLNSSREAYFILLNANAEGLYMLFPQTREEHIRLVSGHQFCTEPMAVSPPTGNELIAAIVFTDKSLLSIDRYLAGDEQIFIEPASWPYNPLIADNAVHYCENLFTNIYNALKDGYSTKSQFIKTFQAVSRDQVDKFRELGISLFKNRKYSDAIAELVKVANADPHDEIAIKYLSLSYFNQAVILFDSKEYLHAKAAFEASLRYDENCKKCSEYVKKSEEIYKKIHYDKGISYFGDEQLAEAIFEWELVYALDPNYREVESNLKKANLFLDKLKQIESN